MPRALVIATSGASAGKPTSWLTPEPKAWIQRSFLASAACSSLKPNETKTSASATIPPALRSPNAKRNSCSVKRSRSRPSARCHSGMSSGKITEMFNLRRLIGIL
jgi:hypothetical protein